MAYTWLYPKRRTSVKAYVPNKRTYSRSSARSNAVAGARAVVPRAARGFVRRSGFYGRFGNNRGTGGELKFLDTALSFNFDTTLEVPATGQLTLIPQSIVPCPFLVQRHQRPNR